MRLRSPPGPCWRCGEGVPPSSFPREAELCLGFLFLLLLLLTRLAQGHECLSPCGGALGPAGRAPCPRSPSSARGRGGAGRQHSSSPGSPAPAACQHVPALLQPPSHPHPPAAGSGGAQSGTEFLFPRGRAGLGAVRVAPSEARRGTPRLVGTGSAPWRWWGLCWRLWACGGAEPAAFWTAQNPGLGAVRVPFPCVGGRKYREVLSRPEGSCRKPRLLLTSAAGDFCEGGSSAENTSGVRKVLSSQIRFA